MDQLAAGSERKEHKATFTVVELALVVLVLAVLTAIVVPKFAGSSERKAERELRDDLATVRNAVRLFKRDTGSYPASLSQLATTKAPNSGVDAGGKRAAISPSDWNGPYLEAVPKDPVSRRTLAYSTQPGSVGDVRSSAAGRSLDRTAYATW